MSEIPSIQNSNFDEEKAATETWEAMLRAGVFIEGNFTFASGLHATLKADTEKLYEHPKELAVVMGHFAIFPHVQNADVLLYVPDGMRQFVTQLGKELQKPEQPVHSLAMLLRGSVKPEYRTALEDHYLLTREIPTDKDEFKRRLQEEWF